MTIGVMVLTATGFFNSSEVHIVRQDNDNVCPAYLNSATDFTLNFRNSGTKSSTLQINVSSNDIDFIKSEDKINLPAEMSNSVELEFPINKTSLYISSQHPIERAQIDFAYSYTANAWSRTRSRTCRCSYEKERNSLYLTEDCE